METVFSLGPAFSHYQQDNVPPGYCLVNDFQYFRHFLTVEVKQTEMGYVNSKQMMDGLKKKLCEMIVFSLSVVTGVIKE